MLLTSNYVYPAEVTGYVREALADFNINQFTLSRWLPNEFIDDIEYRVAAGGTGLADAATYRAYDAESPIGRSQPLSSLIGELPPISLKKRSGEYDRLRMRKVTDQRIRDALFNDARKLTRDIAARVEVARGQTLVTGTTPIPELGITVSWGRAGAHSVTAATLWTNTAADILNDLMSWRDTYLATNGVDPGSLVGSRRIFNLMLRNQAVRNQVFPGANQPSIVTQTAINAMLASEGLPPFTMYQSQVNQNKVATKVMPDNVLLFLPPAVEGGTEDQGPVEDTQLGGTFWGTPAEALDPRFGVDEDDLPGLVAGEYTEEDPISVWTKVAGINLPVMPNPNLSFAATVA
jgi:hypothetical protein